MTLGRYIPFEMKLRRSVCQMGPRAPLTDAGTELSDAGPNVEYASSFAPSRGMSDELDASVTPYQPDRSFQ